MNTIKMFLTGALMMACSVLQAQEQAVSLTLAQARAYALEHNKTLMNARDGIRTSQLKVKETIAQGLPQVDGTMSYMSYFNYEMEFSMGSSEEPNINYALLDAGDAEVLKALGSMFSSEPIIMSDQLTGKVQLSQLLFSGQYLAGIQTAKIAKRLSEQNMVSNELDVLEAVTNTYQQILTSEQTLRIVAENLNNLNKIMEHTRNMYQAGVAEETDVDQLKITVNQLKNTQRSLERMTQLSYNMLKFQLGVAPEANIMLADSLPVLMNALNLQATTTSDFDITRNINYQMMESQLAISKKQVGIASWAYGPTLAGFYSYTGKILTTGFDMNPNHLIGLNLSVPIFSSGIRKAQLATSKVNYDIASRNLEMVKDQLELQKKQLLYTYQNALDNYLTQKENVDVARRVYKSIQNKYEQGLSSSLNLTQANSNYLTAESNYLSSILTLLQAQTSLDKLYNKR